MHLKAALKAIDTGKTKSYMWYELRIQRQHTSTRVRDSSGADVHTLQYACTCDKYRYYCYYMVCNALLNFCWYNTA